MSSALIQLDTGEALTLLRGVEARGKDAAPLFRDILLLMIRSTHLNFEAQGRPRWDDLADSTILRRAAKALKGKGAKKLGSLALLSSIQILRDTGRLMQSVGAGTAGPFDGEDGFGESDETQAVIGTNAPGWQNQFPDTRGWRVAREFLLFQEQDVEDYTAMGMDWLAGTGPYSDA